MGVDLFSDLQPRITKDDEEATNNIIPWLDNLSKTTLMGPVPKYIVFKVNIILQEVDLLREGIFGVNALLIFIDGEKLFLTIHNFIFLLRDVKASEVAVWTDLLLARAADLCWTDT